MLSSLDIGLRPTVGFAAVNLLLLRRAAIFNTVSFPRTVHSIDEQGVKRAAYATNILNGLRQLRYGIEVATC